MKRPNNTRLIVPKGFHFTVKPSYFKINKPYNVYVNLLDGQSIIGYVLLEKIHDNFYVTHSNLNRAYWGRGLGAIMYAWAIKYAFKKGWRVSSSGYSSNLAKRVWQGKTLRKYFTIKYKRNLRKDYDKWYVYPKNK